ncbi:MAG: hypothetical protein ACOCRK_05770 [bacterium]
MDRDIKIWQLDNAIENLKKIKELIIESYDNEKLLEEIDEDILNTACLYAGYIDDFAYCAETGKKITVEQESYFSDITWEWYVDFDAAISHHLKLGYSEEEIKEWNKNADIYFTTYA